MKKIIFLIFSIQSAFLPNLLSQTSSDKIIEIHSLVSLTEANYNYRENDTEKTEPFDIKNIDTIVIRNKTAKNFDNYIIRLTNSKDIIFKDTTISLNVGSELKFPFDKAKIKSSFDVRIVIIKEGSFNCNIFYRDYSLHLEVQNMNANFPYYEADTLRKLMADVDKNKSSIIKELTNTTRLNLTNFVDIRDSFFFLSYYYNDNNFINNCILKKMTIEDTGAHNFVDSLINNAKTKPIITAQALSNATTFTNSITNSVGSFNATIYADAFAKIIVKRFKQDLSEIFFDEMKKEMAENLELKTLLPKTYGLLNTIDRDIYDYKTYIDGLRQRFEEDLANIFANTNNLLETDEYAQKFKNNPTLRGLLSTMAQFSDGLVRKQHPGKVIEQLNFSNAYEQILPDGSANTDGIRIKGALQAIQLFSKGLKSKDSPNYWVTGLDSLNMLFKDDALGVQIWLGLMYQLAVNEKGKPLKLSKDKTLRDAINQLYVHRGTFYEIEHFVKGLYRRANQIGETWQSLQKDSSNVDKKVSWQDMVRLYENTVDFIKFSPTIEEAFDPSFEMPRDWYRGIYLAEALPSLYAEMKGRQYHAAVQHFVYVIKVIENTEVFVNNKDTPLKSITKFYIDKEGKNLYIDKEGKNPLRKYKDFEGLYFIPEKTTKPKKIEKLVNIEGKEIDNTILEKILKYGTFAANLALVKTSDEAAEILESTMTPAGSTRQKEHGFMFGVNSYIGGQYIFKSDSAAAIALSVPIGLNLSYGFGRNSHECSLVKWLPHNVQVLVSLVDVGAFAGLRLESNTDSVPTVRLENLFSPGITFFLGRWFNIPLNLGLGYQAQPRLSTIKDGALQVRPFQWRYTFNLSWDIPLWNIKHWN